jgi:hypothetical protein
VAREGATADPETRRALVRGALIAATVFVTAIAALLAGWTRINDAEDTQAALENRGASVDAMVIGVDAVFPGVHRVRFAYDAGGEHHRHEMVAFGDYERGRPVTAFVDGSDPTRATLPGESPQSGWGWLATGVLLAYGAVAALVGANLLLRITRAWSTLRAHPWTPGRMMAVYPKRNRLAVTLGDDPEEHLVRLGGGDARRLAKLERKCPVYVAGEDRRVVITPTTGRRQVAPGRMDVPLERLSLLHDGARPDRFDVDPDSSPAPQQY